MNLFSLLKQREAQGRPIRVGLIGAGKFGSMYLSQAPRTPGVHVVGVADLNVQRANVALERVGSTFNRVNAIYDIWAASMNTGEFQAVEREMGPRIAAFHDAITQNTGLFARIEAVYRQSVEGQAADAPHDSG